MTQNKKIAVTGGIGSGKSTVLALLKARGYAVFSCDEIYAELCGEQAFLRELDALFPGCVRNNALDRAALAGRVFSDGDARKRLNAFTHPRVMARLMERMEAYPLSFAEVPLLFEGGYESLFDGVLVVLRETGARIAAVEARSGLSEEEIRRRMASQFSYRTLPENCMVLRNDGSLEELEKALDKLTAEIMRTLGRS